MPAIAIRSRTHDDLDFETLLHFIILHLLKKYYGRSPLGHHITPALDVLLFRSRMMEMAFMRNEAIGQSYFRHSDFRTFLDDRQSGHGERVNNVLSRVDVHWPTLYQASDFSYPSHSTGINLSSTPPPVFTKLVQRTTHMMELRDLQTSPNNSPALFRDPQALALELSHAMELMLGQTGLASMTAHYSVEKLPYSIGQPARGSEIVSFCAGDVAEETVRNFYVIKIIQQDQSLD